MAEASTIRAVVRALEGNEALVEVEQGGCGRCHEEGGCGGQHLTQMFCSSPKTYRVENRFAAGVGEHVTVAIGAGSVRRTANLVYVLPVLAGIAGAFVGARLGGDLPAIIGAASGLVLSFVYVRFRSSGSAAVSVERPYIVSRS
jgi:sigma-E factor negative regulatory protein RseC